MSDESNGDDDGEKRVSVDLDAATATATSSGYKVLGELTDASGAGVLGSNDAGSGTPIGVEGRVPNAASKGYGLYTPDNAKVERILTAGGAQVLGDLYATTVLTIGSDFVVEAGSTNTNDATNVVLGHESNTATSGTVAATIGGGGYDDGSDADRNRVTDHYGTVGGGKDNQAGNGDGDPLNAPFGTVGGGENNAATAWHSTVGGGRGNRANAKHSTVGGGTINYARGKRATVSGGEDNAAEDSAAVGGGRSNDARGNASTIGGGIGNAANGTYGTIGGGYINRTGTSGTTTQEAATVGGGESNVAAGYHSTVSGGSNNEASRENATVGGGSSNKARDRRATVGGGEDNVAAGVTSTIAGGKFNETLAKIGTVSGGLSNVAGDSAAIGGGRSNDARGGAATVAGGIGNRAHGTYDAIGGGNNNRTGTSGSSTSLYATVPGGRGNVATGVHSFAAGRQAEATNDGAFVWADGTSGSVTSTASDQFLVEAGGGVGVGTTSPKTQLHVADSIDAGASLGNHVAAVENTVTSGGGDVLALKIGEGGDIESDTNFVTFINGDGTILGSIEGDNSGGVTNASAGSDYAEYLPRKDDEPPMEPGDVVGVHEGELSRETAGADRAMVVSRQPVVAGNDPGPEEQEREGYEKVAFVGQAPAKVRGPADAGDLVVPSGDGDGTARAVSPDAYTPDDDPIVGQVWERDERGGISEVTVAVGLETGDALGPALEQYRARVEDLEAENQRLRERLAAVEAEVGLAGTSSEAPADD